MKRISYLAAGTAMVFAAFGVVPTADASLMTVTCPEGVFADASGAFTFECTVTNSGQTGSIDGGVKKGHNVLPHPAIAPETLALVRNGSGAFTISGTLKDPSIAGSVDVKFKYVNDATDKVTTIEGDVLITPGS